ncbi:replication protein [Cohnella xylanilytica]|uniref:replication protein n=1 Tax=Cohnella xylanilytica TaxID=557555 RepID=UPI0021AAE7B0|nr:replication protein [Cohnella xylanilytica]
MEGWIKLHRKLRENPIFNNVELLRLWLICLFEATHKERDQIVGRQIVHLMPGEFVTGRFDLHAMFNMGLPIDQQKSPKTVWRWLEALENGGFLTIKPTNKYSVVSILNWHKYQNDDQQFDQQVTNKRPTDDQQVTTNKNVKNDKNVKNEDQKTSSRNSKTYSEDSSPYVMAVYLHEKIMDHAEASGVGHLVRNANIQKWADEFRKLLEVDKVDESLVRSVIDWATSHHFWRTNILSASKLRAKFADLAMKMNQERNGRDRSESSQGNRPGVRYGGAAPKNPADSVTGGQLGWIKPRTREVVSMPYVQRSDGLPS